MGGWNYFDRLEIEIDEAHVVEQRKVPVDEIRVGALPLRRSGLAISREQTRKRRNDVG
jgi:hypothetical protein